MSGTAPAAMQPTGISFRPARAADITECGQVWQEALDGYLRRLGRAPIQDVPPSIGRLHHHLLATDPERFVVAEADGSRLLGFGAAVERGGPANVTGPAAEPGQAREPGVAREPGTPADLSVWFLSMLFVRPAEQGRGLGRALLERILPEPASVDALSTVVDSAQPISAALYSQYGIVPRLPLLNLVGSVSRPDALPTLPPGLRAVALDEGNVAWRSVFDEIDRLLLGFAHPADHAFLAADGRVGFVYLDTDGHAAGYGYVSPRGVLGPVAVRDPALLGAVVGHLVAAVPARGATSAWIPGNSRLLLPALLRAGLRIEGFPALACWDRPFASFDRYLPISPGLL